MVPANQNSLITFHSPRGSLPRLSFLLWAGEAALALFNLARIIEQRKYNSPTPLKTLQLDFSQPCQRGEWRPQLKE